MGKEYSLYIVRCSDNTYYTGMTSDIGRRIEQHNLQGPKKRTGSKYTKARQPVTLVFSVSGIKKIRTAMIGEIYIKSLTRQKKELLICGDEKALALLNDVINRV
jgi:putative endonuclease